MQAMCSVRGPNTQQPPSLRPSWAAAAAAARAGPKSGVPAVPAHSTVAFVQLLKLSCLPALSVSILAVHTATSECDAVLTGSALHGL